MKYLEKNVIIVSHKLLIHRNWGDIWKAKELLDINENVLSRLFIGYSA